METPLSDTAKGILALLVVGAFLAVWWIKENWNTFVVLVYILVKVLFYLAIIIIGVYCLTRLF